MSTPELERITAKEATRRFVGAPVDGWKCGCGKCQGKAGIILAVRAETWRNPSSPYGLEALIGHEGAGIEDYEWSTDLHGLFPSVGLKYPTD